MSVWPRMERRRHDRRVVIMPPAPTQIRDDDADALMSIVERSRVGYLAPYTVSMAMTGPNTASRPWVEGRCPVDWSTLVSLESLHRERPTRLATDVELHDFYCRRVLDRIKADCPEHYDLVASWRGWERLCDPARGVKIGAWHGDPTVYNAIATPGGRVVLIDHSPRREGPQEYDFAKAIRHQLIDNDMRVVAQRVSEWRDDLVLIAVIAGMIGSHDAPELVELFKELKG